MLKLCLSISGKSSPKSFYAFVLVWRVQGLRIGSSTKQLTNQFIQGDLDVISFSQVAAVAPFIDMLHGAMQGDP